MSDQRTIPEYPSNNSIGARGAKHMDLRPQKPEVKRITTGVVVKKNKPLLDKIAETFWGEDAGTVGTYIVFDVLLPAAKNTLFDMIKTGAEMLLWGQTTGRPTLRNQNNQPIVNYNGMYTNRNQPQVNQRRVVNRHDLADVIMTNSFEAENVLNLLINHIESYGSVTVFDYYTACGVKTEFTDNNYGWTNLSEATINGVPGGWLINLPRPLPLNRG